MKKLVYLPTAHELGKKFEEPERLPQQFSPWELHSTAVAGSAVPVVVAVWKAQVG